MKAAITSKPETVEQYFASLPADKRALVLKMREIIRSAVPDAEEVISYNMPSFKQHGMLVWYAIYKAHIGFYPKTAVFKMFQEELAPYEISKGTIKFALDQPLPVGLIKKIVRYRLKENKEMEKARSAKPKK